MIESVKTLRGRAGEIKNGYKVFWKDLPYLADCLFENWHDPLSSSRHLTQRNITEWQNLNSFFVRLTSKHFCPWLQLPILELRNALECPQSRGEVMECRIWVATEWIIRCGDVLLHKLTGEDVFGRVALSLTTGPLCRNIRPLGVERWEFWKTRFHEIRNDYQRLDLSLAIYLRMGDTLRRMSAAERDKAFLDRGYQ
ncbi:uncharacterized protein F4807DRAFT_449015 [Annulohypoxylon truncatum]|uniref:uncharacterized protein n=1 Tax=Annulohypoxylon truncatum TaxID=327061 RepID=UPI002007EE0E|nr:uncharacterized protein F4807DRAFT_449015 [Annulohypoxylon truncatum]KAI1204091.1 hypothetical protein F4807DRAFT_449015 [Annulohypoxylon truncatum]